MLIQSLLIWKSNWPGGTFPKRTHPHAISLFVMHHSNVITKISFHNCSIWALITVKLVICWIWRIFLVLLLVLSKPFLRLTIHLASFTFPNYSNILFVHSLLVAKYWRKLWFLLEDLANSFRIIRTLCLYETLTSWHPSPSVTLIELIIFQRLKHQSIYTDQWCFLDFLRQYWKREVEVFWQYRVMVS